MKVLRRTQNDIFKEITSDNGEIRAKFLKEFSGSTREFSDAMGRAILSWRKFDGKIGDSERQAYISALMYTAIFLHIQSLKLFLSGQPIFAGNALRQVLEAIALSLLCSSKDIDILNRFIEDKYRSHRAINDLEKNFEKVGMTQEGVEVFKRAKRIYNKFSHPTLMTLAFVVSLTEKGVTSGASFDQGKLDGYKKEINGRVELANTFVSFIDTVNANVSKWNTEVNKG